jgi:hypothetical protein
MTTFEQLRSETSDELSERGGCPASYPRWTVRKITVATLCVTLFPLALVFLRDSCVRQPVTPVFTAMSSTTGPESDGERTVAEWTKYVTQSLSASPFDGNITGFRILSWVERPLLQDTVVTSRALLMRFGKLSPSDLPAGTADRVGPGFSAVAHRAAPGVYRLEMLEEAEKGRKLALVIPVFRGRQTELVIHRDAEGALQINLCAPRALDPRGRSAETLERLGGAQRDVVNSEGHSARVRLKELAEPVIDDPIGATLAAYFLTIDRRTKELASAAADLTERFPELPDGYVLRALAAEIAGDDQAALCAYHCALDRGLPVLLPFLDYLWDGVEAARKQPLKKIDLDKTRFGKLLREARKSRVPYQLWSVWDLGVPRADQLETAAVR